MVYKKFNNPIKIIKSKSIVEIKNYFVEFFSKNRIDNNEIETFEFYDFANSNLFMYLYKEVISEVCQNLNDNFNDICVQATPTFRKFLPQSHGTSFHNDYLYGHGIESKTVWVPMYGLDQDNSVLFLENKYHKNFAHENLAFKYSIDMEKNLIEKSKSPNLKFDECIVFGAKQIHGSPKNNSLRTRYSFDFRIAKINDSSSTKRLSTYLYHLNHKWIKKPDIFENKKFLKYICGGKDKDTLSQHLTIESIAKRYNIQIVAQEAEIERFGYHILRKNLSGQINNKEYDCIIIASISILDEQVIKEISKSKIKVYSVLEGRFLN